MQATSAMHNSNSEGL